MRRGDSPNQTVVKVRFDTPEDRAAIAAVHEGAFGSTQGPEIVGLVEDLLADASARPLYSMAAEMDGRVVGHVLFTAVQIQPKGQGIAAQILAPLAVLPGQQGKGIGSALIKEGMRQLAAAGVDLVFVLGYPDYYSRFGFRPARALGFDAPYAIPAGHDDAWMVMELKPGVIGRIHGTVQCADTLNDPRHWRE
jgi:putative acetyltransferase